jgi:hypothetical protein
MFISAHRHTFMASKCLDDWDCVATDESLTSKVRTCRTIYPNGIHITAVSSLIMMCHLGIVHSMLVIAFTRCLGTRS